jgi:NtrC-family two-component system sensor histidine kinase KinB
MDFRAADVGQLAEGVVAPFRAQAETQKVDLAIAVPKDLPPVLVDEEKIAWVISNLVANALRYTDPGGRISVSAERHGSKVYVAVADTGHGIPKDQLEAIFEPYVQLPGGKKGGAGLGLAIARDVVRAHGGRIWAESEIGKGSVFTFSVPVER